jgi:DDE family transposase
MAGPGAGRLRSRVILWRRRAGWPCLTHRIPVDADCLPKSSACNGASMGRQPAMPSLVTALPLHRVAGMSLTERLVRLPDPRRRRGVRHPIVSVVLIAASAVVAGARSYTAIGQEGRSGPADHPVPANTQVVGTFAVRIAPRAVTIGRLLERVCPGGQADLADGDPAGATTVAVDGKSARGSRNGHVPSAHQSAAAAVVGAVEDAPVARRHRPTRCRGTWRLSGRRRARWPACHGFGEVTTSVSPRLAGGRCRWRAASMTRGGSCRGRGCGRSLRRGTRRAR